MIVTELDSKPLILRLALAAVMATIVSCTACSNSGVRQTQVGVRPGATTRLETQTTCPSTVVLHPNDDVDGLDRELVPIVATNVVLCRYRPSEHRAFKPDGHVIIPAEVVANLEQAAKNLAPRDDPMSASSSLRGCAFVPSGSEPIWIVLFSDGKRTINLLSAGACVSNFRKSVVATQTWKNSLALAAAS